MSSQSNRRTTSIISGESGWQLVFNIGIEGALRREGCVLAVAAENFVVAVQRIELFYRVDERGIRARGKIGSAHAAAKERIARKDVVADDIAHSADGVPGRGDCFYIYAAQANLVAVFQGFINFKVRNGYAVEYGTAFLRFSAI